MDTKIIAFIKELETIGFSQIETFDGTQTTTLSGYCGYNDLEFVSIPENLTCKGFGVFNGDNRYIVTIKISNK